MEPTIRTFIAVSIPDDILEKIVDLQKSLKPYGSDVKWVRPEGIHITLKFLGNVPGERIYIITETVQMAVSKTEPFSLSIEGIGAFPNIHRPRVLWVGAKQGAETLIQIARNIDQGLSGQGFKREKRPFSPHLTLGRIKSPEGITRLMDTFSSLSFYGGSFDIANINVMKSDLKPHGAEYTTLHTIKLQG
jgi:2'-5' RNA ligase